MAVIRYEGPFFPLSNTTAPSFTSTADNTAVAYVLESTLRVFQGPSARSVRVANAGSVSNYFVKFGSSTVVAASSDSILVPSGIPSVFSISPSQTYISVVSSTTVSVNVTLGYGGE